MTNIKIYLGDIYGIYDKQEEGYQTCLVILISNKKI